MISVKFSLLEPVFFRDFAFPSSSEEEERSYAREEDDGCGNSDSNADFGRGLETVVGNGEGCT